MRTSSLFRRTFGSIVIAALIAGCGGGAASPSAVPSSAPSVAPSIAPSSAPSAGSTDVAAASSPPAVTLWPAPADPMARTVAAGLVPGQKEYFTNHVHAHLDVFVDGVPVLIPAGIGIDIANPDVRMFDVP